VPRSRSEKTPSTAAEEAIRREIGYVVLLLERRFNESSFLRWHLHANATSGINHHAGAGHLQHEPPASSQNREFNVDRCRASAFLQSSLLVILKISPKKIVSESFLWEVANELREAAAITLVGCCGGCLEKVAFVFAAPVCDLELVARLAGSVGFILNGTHVGPAKLHVTHSKDEKRP